MEVSALPESDTEGDVEATDADLLRERNDALRCQMAAEARLARIAELLDGVDDWRPYQSRVYQALRLARGGEAV